MKIFKPIIEDLATFSGSVDITGSLTVTQNIEIHGDITASGNIIPSVSGAFDLGTAELPFRDIYVSQNSLKFISTDTGEEIGRISVNKNTGDIKLLNTKRLTPEQRQTLTAETATDGALSPVSASSIYVSESINPGHTNTTIGHNNQKFHTLHVHFVSASSSTISGSLHVGETVIANSFTGIFNGAISSSAQIASDISGSFTAFSASVATSLGSISTDFVDITNKPTLISGSNQLAGETITGDLTLTGTLTAQTIHVQEVTSSIIYSSGSNIFGSSAGDLQQFTGSLSITGNVSTLGTLTASGYNSTNWDTAFGYGNHASAGYLTSISEATSTVRGGIELFSDTDQSVAANTITATAGRTYGIQLNSAGQAVVNVPWVDTNTTYSVGNGGLTQINFTSALNTKLAGIATGATNVTNTNQLTNGAGFFVSSLSNNVNVNAVSYNMTNYNFTLGPRQSINPMSIKLWDNYFNSSGLGSDYGSLLDIHGRSGHVHSQFYMDAGGSLYYRMSAYNQGWNSWKNLITDDGTHQTKSGILQSNASLRSPIFYDSNNTAYYVDPSSSGNSMVIAGSVNAAAYNKPALLLNSSGTGPAGAAFGMQQVTAEGWTGIFVDYEPFTGWGLYHDNPSNYFCVTAETSTGNLRSFTVPSRVSGNRTAYEKIRFDQNNGSILAGGDITAFSDLRSKKNIETVSNALNKINSVRGVTYERIDAEGDFEGVKHMGVIAQELIDVLPEVVKKDKNGMYSVAYGNIVGVLIEAIKEQQQQIEELKQLIKKL